MNKLKNILIIMLAARLLVSVLFTCHYKSASTSAENKAKSNQKTVDAAVKIITRYVDSSKRNHFVGDGDKNKLPNNWYKTGAISSTFLDSTARALKIKTAQLQEATQISSTTEARALKAERIIDSLKRETYLYKDKYLQLAYRPSYNKADTSDHGQFDYKYNDSLNVVQYWKKNWFLGAKHSYIDIFSNDPRTTINGVKRLVVEQKQPTFGLRVQAVGNYSMSRKLLNVGPGIQFDIKRFSLIGTYYYDFDAQQFRPSFGAKYDIFRF